MLKEYTHFFNNKYKKKTQYYKEFNVKEYILFFQ